VSADALPPFVPQFQFLTDVDGDGRVDHLYCCEAAALTYVLADESCPVRESAESVGPFLIERVDSWVELRPSLGPDSTAGAAVLALLYDRPACAAGDSAVVALVEEYRVPVGSWFKVAQGQPTSALDHEVFFVRLDTLDVLVYDTAVGVYKVPIEEFVGAVGAVWAMEEPVCDVHGLGSFIKGVNMGIATVNHAELRRIALDRAVRVRRLKVPFALAVKGDGTSDDPILADWKDGLAAEVGPGDDLACYGYALCHLDELPVYVASKEFMSWLEDAQDELLTSLKV